MIEHRYINGREHIQYGSLWLPLKKYKDLSPKIISHYGKSIKHAQKILPGSAVTEYREAHNLSQRKLSELVSFPRNYIWIIETETAALLEARKVLKAYINGNK